MCIGALNVCIPHTHMYTCVYKYARYIHILVIAHSKYMPIGHTYVYNANNL